MKGSVLKKISIAVIFITTVVAVSAQKFAYVN